MLDIVPAASVLEDSTIAANISFSITADTIAAAFSPAFPPALDPAVKTLAPFSELVLPNDVLIILLYFLALQPFL
nr:hypothetical protein [Borrelia hermsii]